MSWIPDSLRTRLLLILLGCIVLLQVLSFGAVGFWRGYDSRMLVNTQTAQDVWLVQRRLSAWSASERQTALPYLRRAGYTLHLVPAATPVTALPERVPNELYALQRVMQQQAGTGVSIQVLSWQGHPALRLPLDAASDLLVAFPNGLPSTQPAAWQVLLYIALVSGIVLAVSAWAVSLATRPLARMTQASQALARDVQSPGMPEQGSREMRSLAASFNHMQRAVQQQLQDRTHMLAAISHDLKTPLTRLQLRLGALPEDSTRTLMQADLDAMGNLIDEGLEYARSTRLREPRLPVRLNGLIDSVVEQYQDLGESCSWACGPDVTVQAAPRALQRLLQNLIDNALRYGQCADVSLHCTSGGVEIQVADRGPGIAQEHRERMFQPFVRGEQSRDRDTGGTGLGLAIARNIAQAHGGRLWLSSRGGGGLIATLWLPLVTG